MEANSTVGRAASRDQIKGQGTQVALERLANLLNRNNTSAAFTDGVIARLDGRDQTPVGPGGGILPAEGMTALLNYLEQQIEARDQQNNRLSEYA